MHSHPAGVRQGSRLHGHCGWSDMPTPGQRCPNQTHTSPEPHTTRVGMQTSSQGPPIPPSPTSLPPTQSYAKCSWFSHPKVQLRLSPALSRHHRPSHWNTGLTPSMSPSPSATPPLKARQRDLQLSGPYSDAVWTASCFPPATHAHTLRHLRLPRSPTQPP